VIDLTSGWKIDFIFRKSRAFSREEFKRRQQVTVQELPMFVTTAEDVVIAKLEWAKLGGSLRQIEDVVAILGAQGEALDKSYVEKWIRELGLIEQWTRAKRLGGLPS
jgi:hypothetical protein